MSVIDQYNAVKDCEADEEGLKCPIQKILIKIFGDNIEDVLEKINFGKETQFLHSATISSFLITYSTFNALTRYDSIYYVSWFNQNYYLTSNTFHFYKYFIF